ncbi:discoidin domain-containing protein [Paenibacillus sp. FSL R10-2734]|uniref:alpha-1,3-galactosidase-related protein n=1 Tax=Paenibacillus sp. FSL R10-2734 TaxID=2954691 RepID=UPI0030DDC301
MLKPRLEAITYFERWKMMSLKPLNAIALSFLLLVIICIFHVPTASAATSYTKTTEIKDGETYSVITVNYTGDDAGPAVNEAIAAAQNATKPVILDFPNGTYNFKDSSAISAQYYISNASTASQTPGGLRKIGLLFKNISDITIRGNGSTLLFHGVMTPIVFDHATNVNMNNISFDFKRPVMSELTVTTVGSTYFEADIHPDSLYKIANNKLQWTGEVDSNGNPLDNWVAGGFANITQVQGYNPNTKETWRSSNPLSGVVSAQDLGNRKVRFNFNSAPAAVNGYTYQLRNDIRKEQGAFIYRSKDVTWTGVSFHAAPGLGIVGQYSENLDFENLNFAPKTGSGRTNASMADFMQFSGVKGKIKVNNSNFFGAHDDPINVHGTHLRIVDKPASNQIKVRFMHSQSWGFDAFTVNDTIEYIEGSSLLSVDSAKVTAISRINDSDILLTLDKDVPSMISVNNFYVENVTWTPNVTITGNTFDSLSTRPILVTTRGKVLIDNNTFNRPKMSSIIIADDASSWYESGMVKDVTISNNTFNYGVNPVISIEPSTFSTNPDKTVHSNINIDGNVFKMNGNTSIYTKGVNGFSFNNNIIQEGGLQLSFQGSKNVSVDGNSFIQSGVTKSIALSYMYTDTDTIDAAQGFSVSRSNNYVPVIPNPNVNLSLTATATASSQMNNDFVPNNAKDGNTTSKWAPATGKGSNEWLQIDFGSSKSFNQVVLSEFLDRTTGNKIQYYNGSSWVDLASGTTIAVPVKHTFTAVTAQKVRFLITGTKTDSNGWGIEPNITEFEVYDVPVFERITTPTAITGVANGTAKTAAALGLPTKVALVTDKRSYDTSVVWNVNAANYVPATTTGQTFTVSGVVTLPNGVANPNNVALTTSISVTVLPDSLIPQATLTGEQKVSQSQSFELTMGLNNVTQSVYQSVNAQDLTLHFDPLNVQFETVTSLKDGFQVISTKEKSPGQIRIILASVGVNVPAQGDLLSFKFKANSVSQETNTTISIDQVVIANGQGKELQVGGASREIQISIPTTPVDKTLLNTLIASAQAKQHAAVEGNEDGLYTIGSKTVLQSAIDTALTIANDPKASQQLVDSAKAAMETAIQIFDAKKITADVNRDGSISIGDLAIVAKVYGSPQGQADWNEKTDVNHDGTVDILDLAIVAKAILQ